MTIQKVDKFHWVLLKIIRDHHPISEQDIVSVCKVDYPQHWETLVGSEMRTKPVGWPAAPIIGGFIHLLKHQLITVCDADGNDTQEAYYDRSFTATLSFSNQFIFQISEFYHQVSSIFPVSLSLYVDQYIQPYSVIAHPDFEIPTALDVDVFVIMPYRDELQAVYQDAIAPAILNLSLQPKRGDDFAGSKTIMDEVWSAIYNCKLCIADCSGNNPNVFYELGIAHTLGKPVILISQYDAGHRGILGRFSNSPANVLPFDIRHRRVIRYEMNNGGLDALRQHLEESIPTMFS